MATNDPFRDFRRRRGSLFDEFFSDFFDRPFGADQGTGPSAVRPGTPAQTARRRVEQVDITDFFSDATRELLQRAAQRALEWGSLDLDSEHLLWAAMQDDLVAQIVRQADGDPQAIAAQVADEAERGGRTDVAPSLSPEAKAALLRAYDEMRELNSSYLGPEHVLLALARDTDSDAGRLLARFGLSHTALRGAVIRGVTQTEEGGRPASQTKTLDEYSRDLTEAAREGRLDPVIGRADEIEETIEILSRRTKNNPVLIGDPGVGKTAIAEYRRNIEKDAALERRFQPVLIDEPSVDETIEILHGLKDRYEAYHRVRISPEALVAAAELSDRYITDRFLPDKAIDLIDQAAARVRLRAKTKPADRRALEDELARNERERDQAVAAEDYERANSLKARIDELREQVDESRSSGRERAAEVLADDVAEVVSRRTGIPVTQLTQEERERLLGLEAQMHERVVGQDEAVEAVARAVRRARAGLGDPNRPVGSFLFLGPTGVGKTELARALAETLFGDEDAMARFDMSEFQERHTVSRLVGAPPGYVGYEDAGRLTETVRRRPYSVLLLDEIEKAHADVFNILLQLLEDGRLTDGQGRTVDFRHTVVIMTSNLGADRIQAHARRGESFDDLKAELMEVLRQSFRPELLNRIDEIIVFRSLDRAQLMQITRLLLDRVARRIHAQGVELEVSDEAVEYLANAGFDPQYGARPLRRAIQRLLEDELSERLLAGEIESGQRVRVELRDGRLHVGPVSSRSSPDAETAGSAA